ncbi:apolipoprotein N-acyltransferase [Labrys monachus]|uniref:Apolipoprotein N-acyltransferase n=1 Tax=Labrys monachus TaxID=217067 RepID=A0ABU0FDR3_9HYPH|nr:apolipoprotein N-acyltransferase [Labrys monachus]MDQ0392566.1 apolipoprotein N-acyltransferase [Labrys monachus]
MITRLSTGVATLRGWRRAGLAFAAGALAALAMAPFDLFPVLAISLPVAVWLLDGLALDGPPDATGRTRGFALRDAAAAAGLGWLFGLGYFLAGLWWIGSAFLVDADQFAWLMPFAVVMLPAGLALFTALAFALARLLWSPGPGRIAAFAVALAGAEWLRGHVLTGFPWNLFGYALASEIHLAQSLSLVGIYGLTLITLLLFASPALMAGRGGWRWPALALALLLAMAGFGAWRLAGTPTSFVDKVQLRIMQPNVPQNDKFNPSLRNQILTQYLALSRQPTADGADGMAKVTDLIWPESAFPFLLSSDPDALAVLGDLLKPNAVLLTGAGRAEQPTTDDGPVLYYNSLHVIDATGTIIGNYDKVHLVPFGEYLPFQSFLESIGLRQLTEQRGGFTPGPGLRTLDIPNAPPVGVLVCYEAIFPDAAIDAAHRPGWLLNVTNDGWFGLTPGPYQHFVQARARAVEEGLPLVRAGNDGISAVIDPVGRVLARLPLGTSGVLDSRLPAALAPTAFAKAGNTIIAILFLIATICAVCFRRAPQTEA